MKRRDFITLLGGTVLAGPVSVLAQQSAMPMVGFVTGLSSNYLTGRKPGVSPGVAGSGLCRRPKRRD
jgi:hypothetical protein